MDDCPMMTKRAARAAPYGIASPWESLGTGMRWGMEDDEWERLRRAASSGSTRTPQQQAEYMLLLHERAPRELAALLAEPEHTPAQLRRIAELVEVVEDDASARVWWERAAEAGDEDAQDYLGFLVDEESNR